MDANTYLKWLCYRYPHLDEYSEEFKLNLIRLAKKQSLPIRALTACLFIVCCTFSLYCVANLIDISIFQGIQGLVISSYIVVTIQLTTTPFNRYLIKQQIHALIAAQKV